MKSFRSNYTSPANKHQELALHWALPNPISFQTSKKSYHLNCTSPANRLPALELHLASADRVAIQMSKEFFHFDQISRGYKCPARVNDFRIGARSSRRMSMKGSDGIREWYTEMDLMWNGV